MNYYNQIKEQLINNEIYKEVKDYSKNRSDLNTYYNVGKLIVEAQGGEKRAKYGDKLIKEYSQKLTKEIGKGFSTRSLKNMRKSYMFIQKGQTLSAQLTWSHYTELLQFDDSNKILYYVERSIKLNLSVRELRAKIKNKEYERLDEKTKEKFINQEETKVEDLIKNPIIIQKSSNYEVISEKILQKLILEDIPFF